MLADVSAYEDRGSGGDWEMVKQIYKETGNIYSAAAEVQRIRRKKREKRNRILLRAFVIMLITATTFALHAFNVWRNGYEGIGSEIFIPFGALLVYGAYKSIEDDKRRRREYREKLMKKNRELTIREFREYDRVKNIKKAANE